MKKSETCNQNCQIKYYRAENSISYTLCNESDRRISFCVRSTVLGDKPTMKIMGVNFFKLPTDNLTKTKNSRFGKAYIYIKSYK